MLRFQLRPINWSLLTIESPVAQWLETRSRRAVGLNPIWNRLGLFPSSPYIYLLFIYLCIIYLLFIYLFIYTAQID